jgi:hypothetical protein
MAITAINSVVADMVFVAELNGLLARNESKRVVGGALILGDQEKHQGDEENRAEYAQPGNDVRAATKDLAHFLVRSEMELKTARANGGRKCAVCFVDDAPKGVQEVAGVRGK